MKELRVAELIIEKKSMYLFSVIGIIIANIILFLISFELIKMTLTIETLWIKFFFILITLCFVIFSFWLLIRIIYMLKAYVIKIPLIKLDEKGIYYDSILGIDFITWEECKGYNFNVFNYQAVIHIEIKDYDEFYKKMKFSKKCIYKFNA